jgi:hypothetical protein
VLIHLIVCSWLDEGEDDGLIERELLVGAEEGQDWKITTVTGKDKEEGAASTAKIVVIIYGDKGHSVPVPLSEEEHTFEEGKEEEFEVINLSVLYFVNIWKMSNFVPKFAQVWLLSFDLSGLGGPTRSRVREEWESGFHPSTCLGWVALPGVESGRSGSLASILRPVWLGWPYQESSLGGVGVWLLSFDMSGLGGPTRSRVWEEWESGFYPSTCLGWVALPGVETPASIVLWVIEACVSYSTTANTNLGLDFISSYSYFLGES